jgi:hypothetical protein
LSIKPKSNTQPFDLFTLAIILLNTVVLMMKWPNMSTIYSSLAELINTICTVFFIIEATLKLIAFDKNYFKDGWNIFDFIIVLGSLLFMSPRFAHEKKTMTILRAFRISRAFKLFSKLKQLTRIFTTVEYTLQAMMNLIMLMLLIIYLFAIIGVYLFAHIKINPPLSNLINFSTLPNACLTLWMALT